MKRRRHNFWVYIVLIVFELLLIKGIKLVYEKKTDNLGNTSEVSVEKIVSLEEADKGDDIVQNNLYSVSTTGYYYVCTVSLTNHTADDTYTPNLRASSDSDSYISVDRVDYYDNSYTINDFGYGERIPALSTVDRKYIVYSKEKLDALTVSVYDYTTEKNTSSASIVLD